MLIFNGAFVNIIDLLTLHNDYKLNIVHSGGFCIDRSESTYIKHFVFSLTNNFHNCTASFFFNLTRPNKLTNRPKYIILSSV